MHKNYFLYFDDTGSRDPDKRVYSEGVRDDEMDCFALGGVLIKEENIDLIFGEHKAFCSSWNIDYPLHSQPIRGGRLNFGWLKKPENAHYFLTELENFLLSLPIIGIACVIHRPGYVARYKDRYKDKLWHMCRTTYSILIERAAKFADMKGRKLEIYYEGSGRKEDRDIVRYARALKTEGSPFDRETSGGYTPLLPEDYRRIILGEPHRKTKKTPMIQIADLVLYPIAKAGYDPNYRSYRTLKEHKKLIDCYLTEAEVPYRGIKFSCFEG